MTAAGKRPAAALGLFLLLTLGGGMLIGSSFPPGAWYAGLAKPGFTPPDWLFPVAWTVLYVLVAVAGRRVFARDLGAAQTLWVAQLALNFAWSPTFFGAHRIGAGLAVLSALLLAVAGFVLAAWRGDRPAAACFLPYGAWVAYATALNLSILRLN